MTEATPSDIVFRLGMDVHAWRIRICRPQVPLRRLVDVTGVRVSVVSAE